MNELFLKIINMSISASWLVLAVLILRLVLKNAPKWINVLLWGIVAVRLICPFSIESALSLIPSAETIPLNIGMDTTPTINSGINAINNAVNPFISQSNTPMVGASVNPLQITIGIFEYIWIFGMIALAIYTAISYWRLRRKVDTAVRYQDNIFQSENVASPFVLGIIKPKIYLPFNMNEQDLEHVVAHEQAHIRRKDHWWKPLGFLLLTIHWFNPLMWLAYVLLCRDIELACDEKVIKELGNEQRADYTQALVACSVNRRMIAACPLAFGEVGVKDRVKSVMNYKKPAFWIIVVASISCIVVAICFLTNPISKNTIVMGANYDIEKVLYAVTVGDEISTDPPLQYCVTADYHLYYQQTEGEDWMYLGALIPYDLTNDELDKYMPVDDMRKNAKVRQITDAYSLRIENDNFYLVFQTKDGKTYLAYGWEDVGERGQAGSDDTRLRRLYLLNSSFHSGYVNVNFFQRSLVNTVGNYVYNFANFESDKIPGYHITGFKSGSSTNHNEMKDLGFAVFQTTGEGYRLIDCKVYENAALVENGIFFCSDPAVADVNGEMRNDNTFDILLILNEDVDKVERVYHAEGKKDYVQADTYINAPYMSVWSWEYSDASTSVSQYVYDKDGNKLSYDSVIPLNSASWKDLPNGTDGTVTQWFDYLETPEEMQWDGRLEINLPDFPDVTFRWYPEKMEAVTEDGITPLYTGMPIWNTYFCDLTGDGLPDLCSTYTFGSGIIDSRIIIYDYANGASYELSDRGNYDFSLRYNETDGQLYVDKTIYNTDELVESGRLAYEDNCIQIIPTEDSSAEEKWDLIPMVMVDGTLYLTTGHESTVEGRCGVMDGEITSQVDGSEKPTVDNQSNFGTGYGYQYGAIEGTIEIYMNGKWWIYATEEVRQEIQFPSTTDRPNQFYLTIGAEGVKSIELSMPNSSGGFENADGSLLKKGERIWFENLDGYEDLCGLTITALGENGEIIWTASIPDEEENKGFTHLKNDDWEITNIE